MADGGFLCRRKAMRVVAHGIRMSKSMKQELTIGLVQFRNYQNTKTPLVDTAQPRLGGKGIRNAIKFFKH
jgi:hypothetical protein